MGSSRHLWIATSVLLGLAGCNQLLDLEDLRLDVDAGTATTDGGVIDAFFIDAPDCAGAVDGQICADEWSTGVMVENTVVSSWGTLNQLHRLRARIETGTLHLAIEGVLESGRNAFVVFVDGRTGSGIGADPAAICDAGSSFTLDASLSVGIAAGSAFRADLAWGTVDLSPAIDPAGAQTGWRGMANLGALDSRSGGTYQTACSLEACEMSVALADLGADGVSAGTLAVFARLTNNDIGGLCGGHMMSNQCLPEDAPTTPWSVSAFLTIDH